MFETQRFMNQALLREMFGALYAPRRRKLTGLLAFCVAGFVFCLLMGDGFLAIFYLFLTGITFYMRRGWARVADGHILQEQRRSPSLLLCAQTWFEDDQLCHRPDTDRLLVQLPYSALSRLEETDSLFVLVSKGGATVPVFKSLWSEAQQEAWLRFLAGKAPRLKGLGKALKGRTLFKNDPAGAAKVEFSTLEPGDVETPAPAPAEPLPPLEGRFLSSGVMDVPLIHQLVASQTDRRRAWAFMGLLVPLNIYIYATLPLPWFAVILAGSVLAAAAIPRQEKKNRERFVALYREMGVLNTRCSTAFDEVGFTTRNEATGKQTRFEYPALVRLIPHKGGYFLITREHFVVLVFTEGWSEEKKLDFLDFLQGKNTGLPR